MANLGFLETFNVWGVAKVFVLLGLAIYLVFAGMVIKQVKLMKETIGLGLDQLVVTIAWGHFLLAGLMLAAAFILL